MVKEHQLERLLHVGLRHGEKALFQVANATCEHCRLPCTFCTRCGVEAAIEAFYATAEEEDAS